MATATVRNVDDNDYADLAATANENGRSISDELRIIIAEHVRKRRADKLMNDMLAFVKRDPLKLPNGQSMQDLLRDERDSW